MRSTYYASVTIRAHVALDLHGAEPTIANLLEAARSQMRLATEPVMRATGRGVSYGEPDICQIVVQHDLSPEGGS